MNSNAWHVFFTNNEECAKRNANGAAMPLMPEEERDQDVRDMQGAPNITETHSSMATDCFSC